MEAGGGILFFFARSGSRFWIKFVFSFSAHVERAVFFFVYPPFSFLAEYAGNILRSRWMNRTVGSPSFFFWIGQYP